MDARSTPSQTVGPYFSIGFAWMERNDLTEGASNGTRVSIRGRVLDGEGQPIPDAVLEIWQADPEGHYAWSDLASAKHFSGFGRVSTNNQGEFCFTTLKPGSVPAPDGGQQAPHLEVSVFMRGLLRRLITRIYFPAEPANETDLVLGLVPGARRHTLIAQPDTIKADSLVWDIYLQGDQETVFFEY
jgi:protocatechuate 3,4-dioxygenase alpha subunit